MLLYEVYDQNYQQQQYGNGTGIADAEILECVGVYNIGYSRCAVVRPTACKLIDYVKGLE